ncbi:MFS transporter [Chloroflexota bacterium]
MKWQRPFGLYYGYIIVVASVLILTITQGTYYSFGIFLKPLAQDFGWTRAAVSGAVSLGSIVSGVSFIFAGHLTDRVGPRLVMIMCGLSLGIGYLLMSRIQVVWQFYLVYGIMIGIGMSGFIPLVSTVSRWFVRRRGLMTGIVASGTGLGTLLVPPLANWLIIGRGWQSSYVIMGTVALVAILPVAQFLRRDPSQVGQLPYGEVVDARRKNLEPEGTTFMETIKMGQFRLLVLAKICYGFAVMVIMVHIFPHATDLGISTTDAANIVALVGGVGVVGRVFMGITGDRIGHRWAYASCFILALAAIAVITASKEIWAFYLLAVLFGFAYGGMATSPSLVVAELFGLRAHGQIFGSISFGTTIGTSIGPLVAGYIYDVTGSYQLAFIICLVLLSVGTLSILGLKPWSKPVKQGWSSPS